MNNWIQSRTGFLEMNLGLLGSECRNYNNDRFRRFLDFPPSLKVHC